ncbi:hypothetical protein [Labedaea rhizosphaerae]|uniref:Aminoacyl-transfer RNA synthetases class-II family profile domain-containing protein n=1 Tax=Labedaea rhizosphaerae TaxID=598644 RepID=A0A4R6S0F2_LABRH|nr:hypothetical protein [Labedaea rhizosphaerae]TDP92962.1 hypothetical protein EV186_107197 [Labedaea rhizosphaerae]
MTEHTITLGAELPEFLAKEFAKRVYFAAEEIRDFRLVGSADRIDAVVVRTDGDGMPAGLPDKLRFLLQNDVLSQLVRDPKVIWESAASHTPSGDTFNRLVDMGVAYEVGEGQVAVGQPLLDLMDDLDRVVRRIVTDEFAGQEFRYPTLIPIDALHRCDYFTSFPQYAMFATRLKSDVDNYREFVERAKDVGQVGAEILDRCAGVDYCLPPTMCYHTFNQFAGRSLPQDLACVTARGKSFRHEARYHRSLARLWDFTIREIVFFGTRDEVLSARERFLGRALRLADELGVSGQCEVATDPFFCNSDTSTRTSSQRLLELKYELQLDIAPEDRISVASFNFHERFFGESFGITLPDGATTPFSGCAGFGLERFAFALVCQHGIDVEDWPAQVRAALGHTTKERS